MANYNGLIKAAISDDLYRLSWKCSGCPQVSVCEEQLHGESRYCWPMIEAAILGHDNWETEHDKDHGRGTDTTVELTRSDKKR